MAAVPQSTPPPPATPSDNVVKSSVFPFAFLVFALARSHFDIVFVGGGQLPNYFADPGRQETKPTKRKLNLLSACRIARYALLGHDARYIQPLWSDAEVIFSG